MCRYTIEARELTNGHARRLSDEEPMTIEASDPEAAISQFVVQSASELVSVTTPARGAESIATVKNGDSVYLVRVYAQ